MTIDALRDTAVRDEAREALARGVAHLRSLQYPGGYWWGELESNSTIASEHVFMLHLFGLATDDLRRRLGNELLATQRDDGSWANWWNGPADLSTTVESYYALRLCGIPADDPSSRWVASSSLPRRRRRSSVARPNRWSMNTCSETIVLLDSSSPHQ